VVDDQSAPSKVIFQPASGIDETAVAQVQAKLRRRILRAFVGRGLLESFEAKEMLAYRHSGFTVDTSGRIEAHDRAGLERLLRYCARPAFSMERLRKDSPHRTVVTALGQAASIPMMRRAGTSIALVNNFNLWAWHGASSDQKRPAFWQAWCYCGYCLRACTTESISTLLLT
jgi:Putative transposase